MPTLHLDQVPEELFGRIKELAVADQVPLAEEALRLLQEAVVQKALANSGPQAGRSQRAILDEIRGHPFAAQPTGPSVVEMVREDRQR